MRIGLDLDNTLIDYNALFVRLAVEQGLAPGGLAGKTAVRNHVLEHSGDETWQCLQAKAYGERLDEAVVFPGVLETLRTLRRNGHSLNIISHKTARAAILGGQGPDLHEAARRFLKASGLAELVDDVIFTASREEKCAAIAGAGCDAFVDDLPEVFRHSAFPSSCRKIIFGEDPEQAVLRSWPALPLLLEPQNHEGKTLSGGRNSRTRRVDGVVVKEYPDDGRMRCRTEWRTLIWLRENGFGNVPEPLACDLQRHFIVMEYIKGKWPEPDDRLLDVMNAFILRLYALRDKAVVFPPAADACFSLEEIREQLERRIERLLAVSAHSSPHRSMQDFVCSELRPALDSALTGCLDFGTLPENLRFPSPSDFGPHNALVRENGEVIFLDFEYFGLDDPVKLAADITLHPGTELTASRRATLVETLLGTCEQAGDWHVRERFCTFLPLWRLKWCCILLNEFIPLENARRVFAGMEEDHEARLQAQFDKAKKMLYASWMP